MFERIKRALHACKGVYTRRNELAKKLVRSPFFPILFIGETVKVAVISAATTGVLFPPAVVALGITAILVTLVWVFAEHLLEQASESVEQAKETVEEVTEN